MATKKSKKTLAEMGALVLANPIQVQVASINRAPYNPRTISKADMDALKASILKYGLILNFVVQKNGMVMLGGHQRLTACEEICKERGWKMPETCWAVIMDVDDRTAKQVNIMLNKIGGDFDPYKLGMIFNEIYPYMTPDDVLATGFATEEIVELRDLAIPPTRSDDAINPEGDIGAFAKSVTLSVAFDTIEQRDQVKDRLAQVSKDQGMKPGALIARMLSMTSAMGGRSKRVSR